jgi:hypothetical protein
MMDLYLGKNTTKGSLLERVTGRLGIFTKPIELIALNLPYSHLYLGIND